MMGLALSWAGALPAAAHPHAFGQTSLWIIFDAQGLAAIRVRWVFDEMFSTLITDEFDPNHDGRLSPAEQQGIKKGAFDNLAGFGYFTHIWVEGRPFKIEKVTDFKASINKHQLIYEFTIPCPVPAGPAAQTVVISPHDHTYYTSLELAPGQAIELQCPPGLSASFQAAPNPKRAIYFGQVHPMEVKVTFRKKS